MLALIAGTYAAYLAETIRSRTVSIPLLTIAGILILASFVVPDEYRIGVILWAVLPAGVVSIRSGNHGQYGAGSAIVSVGALGLAIASWPMLPAKISFGVLFGIINLTLLPTLFGDPTLKRRVHWFMILMLNTILIVVTAVLSTQHPIGQVLTGLLIYDASKLLSMLTFMPGETLTEAQAARARTFFERVTSKTNPLEKTGASAVVLLGIGLAFLVEPLTVAVGMLGLTNAIERVIS